MSIRTFKSIVTVVLFLFSSYFTKLYAQSDTLDISVDDTVSVGDDFFNTDDPFNCTMEFDIKSYQRNKYEGKYMPIKMTYYDLDSIPVKKEFKVKARGNFRRQHCGLPPLWLNVKKANLVSEQFQDVNKIKLVTHCRGGNSYNQYVLKEYLTYKIYNLISAFSFRVRLAEIKYIDTGRKHKTYTYWAFLIEPEMMMADRLNCIPIKADKLGNAHTDSSATDVMALFQYMIGNGDYSITGRHNLKLIKENDPFKVYPIPVPYDFDYSGLVNAYYAIPRETLGIEKVTDRFFLGPCRSDDEYHKALKVILDKENEIVSLVKEFPYLDDKGRAEMIDYLKSFFRQANQEWFISRDIKSTCRN
jgi:hypothetical protein